MLSELASNFGVIYVGCFCKILKWGCCRQETREGNSLGKDELENGSLDQW